MRKLLLLPLLAALVQPAAAQTVYPQGTTTPAISQVGGLATGLYLTPTVTAAAYSSGQVMGGLLTLSPAARGNVASALIQQVRLTSASGMNGSYDLLLFNSPPTSSTITDHATLALAASDLPALIGVIHLTDVTSLGTPTVTQAAQQAFEFSLASGTTLSATIVARSAVTPASASDITLALSEILQ